MCMLADIHDAGCGRRRGTVPKGAGIGIRDRFLSFHPCPAHWQSPASQAYLLERTHVRRHQKDVVTEGPHYHKRHQYGLDCLHPVEVGGGSPKVDCVDMVKPTSYVCRPSLHQGARWSATFSLQARRQMHVAVAGMWPPPPPHDRHPVCTAGLGRALAVADQRAAVTIQAAAWCRQLCRVSDSPTRWGGSDC